MLKIRRPLGRLIFNMGIAIPGKTVFLIETTPRSTYQICIHIINWIYGFLFWYFYKEFNHPSTDRHHQTNCNIAFQIILSNKRKHWLILIPPDEIIFRLEFNIFSVFSLWNRIFHIKILISLNNSSVKCLPTPQIFPATSPPDICISSIHSEELLWEQVAIFMQ